MVSSYRKSSRFYQKTRQQQHYAADFEEYKQVHASRCPEVSPGELVLSPVDNTQIKVGTRGNPEEGNRG